MMQIFFISPFSDFRELLQWDRRSLVQLHDK